MPPPVITPLPPPPLRNESGAAFSAKAEAWSKALPEFSEQLQALVAYVANLSGGAQVDLTGITAALDALADRVDALNALAERIDAIEAVIEYPPEAIPAFAIQNSSGGYALNSTGGFVIGRLN